MTIGLTSSQTGRREWSLLLILIIVAGMVGIGAAGSFSVSRDHSTYIYSPGYWELDDSLYDFNSTDCIVVQANDVIIDGKGRTLQTDPSNQNPGAAIRLNPNVQRVTVKNFNIAGAFNWSIYCDNTDSAWIEKNELKNNQVGIYTLWGGNINIKDNMISSQKRLIIKELVFL